MSIIDRARNVGSVRNQVTYIKGRAVRILGGGAYLGIIFVIITTVDVKDENLLRGRGRGCLQFLSFESQQGKEKSPILILNKLPLHLRTSHPTTPT